MEVGVSYEHYLLIWNTMSKQLLAKVAHFYYRDRLTMAEIGARLAMSRHKVGRMLQEAVESGVVRIEIRTPEDTDAELEHELEQVFGLKACMVVSVDESRSREDIKQRTCEVGADFLRDLIKENDTVGVGWGSTTFGLVNHLKPEAVDGAKVIQITGGNKWVNAAFDCHEVTRCLAERLGVQPIILHAPGIVDKKRTRDLLLQESSVAEVVKEFDGINIAVVGIGALVPEQVSALLDSGYVSAREREMLIRAGAVGDAFSYFVDDLGNIVPSDINDRIVTIGIDKIRRIPTLIGVAAGAVKARAVAAVVRSSFVNTLIVDSTLARALLEQGPGDHQPLASAEPGKHGSRKRPGSRDGHPARR